MDHGVHNGSMGGSAALVVLLVVLPSVLLIIYLVVAGRELRRSTWSGWRTASFAVGTLLIIAAISPPLSDWAHRDLRDTLKKTS